MRRVRLETDRLGPRLRGDERREPADLTRFRFLHSVSSSAQGRCLHPPRGLLHGESLFRRRRLIGRAEQSEAGRARAGHARQRAAGRARNAASTSAMTGCQRDGRRLQIVGCSASKPHQLARARELCDAPLRRGRTAAAGEAVQPANTALVGSATPGLTSTAGRGGSGSGADRIVRRCRASARARIEADRHVGAGRARRGIESRDRRRAMPFASARRRNAAAASAEPPPRPAATGSSFVEIETRPARGRRRARRAHARP